MIVYGRNAVHEALRGPRQVSAVWVTRGAARESWLADPGVPLAEASAEQILARCGSEGHQGICAEVEPFTYADATALLTGSPEPLLIALDEVQDPQNLGSIIRSAECAGAAGLIICERRAAEVTPAVCKASAGAVEHLPVARVRNLADFLGEAKRAGLWCYGADGDAALDYRQVDFSGGVVLVLGSEGRGLRPRVAAGCDALVSLPLRGKIESLSVGAAAAVLLYAAAR
ncbi:23S rRNA (guanosine(2251)-2'-O)-methyltransferase RlmB [Conexibacter sp. DBS9H8]|uniref:23S rRNA (guanosine(2251)-2'-O)-methyltransferase RlmB n=1 Tax=Conexibacter sp. DBS9H8 TaxID=2937801 RepID=UPI00201077FE|nr:23S rRNA (guanosine(2251)-2'-O)-methyltransferase RlmB [Conexibacter sp. DBS9H8]